MDYARLRNDARDIFEAGVASVDPRPMVARALRVEGRTLFAGSGSETAAYDLGRFDRVLVLGYGKAGASMARGAEDALGSLVSGGVVAVKAGHAERRDGEPRHGAPRHGAPRHGEPRHGDPRHGERRYGDLRGRVAILEASHPVPDASSVEAARAVMEAAREADARTLALVLVSGGGSAILCAPYDKGGRSLSLADKAAVTRELLACGADIREVNAVRRHLSAVKGGRLAELLAPATVLALVLSDVIGDDLSSIASGPTVPDRSSWSDALGIVRRFGIEGRIPESARRLLADGAAGLLPDTPKPGDGAFRNVRHLVIGSNSRAAEAASLRARRLGYRALNLGSRITGEAREIAKAYLGMALDCAASGVPRSRPACLIAGGETTVTLRGPGKGGRNQEMALAFLAGLADADGRLAGRACFLSAGTDGNDGPTDAAGAFADLGLLEAARKSGLDPRAYLAANDSYAFFDGIGGLLRTGPTNTNVCDLQVVLVR